MFFFFVTGIFYFAFSNNENKKIPRCKIIGEWTNKIRVKNWEMLGDNDFFCLMTQSRHMRVE